MKEHFKLREILPIAAIITSCAIVAYRLIAGGELIIMHWSMNNSEE
ncbi:MAG: hypothetical protein K5854_02830 [Prevotella sp.]|jgi:hypothetical protein|nr:hypothetical protein [Prevotella sp.]